jgi:hypothetical protein
MSTNQATFKALFDFDLIARGVAVRAAKVVTYFGSQPSAEPADTSAAGITSAGAIAPGLASLLGKYNGDPSWEDFPTFLEGYRRAIDDMNRE